MKLNCLGLTITKLNCLALTITNQKENCTFTCISHETLKITNLLKNMGICIAFKTTDIAQNHLKTKTTEKYIYGNRCVYN
jgi:hypothetical protein